jgi:hypothetical protein
VGALGATRREKAQTNPTLKATLSVALATACPVTHIYKFMQLALVEALHAFGRGGDSSRIPSQGPPPIQLISFEVASEEKKRDRTSWWPLLRARRIAAPDMAIAAAKSAIETAAAKGASAAAEAAAAAAFLALGKDKARAMAALASARAAVRRVAEEAAADVAADAAADAAAAVGQADDEDGTGDVDLNLPLKPQLEATRLTSRRHCARAPGKPIARAFWAPPCKADGQKILSCNRSEVPAARPGRPKLVGLPSVSVLVVLARFALPE